jgi:hypothetical protein
MTWRIGRHSVPDGHGQHEALAVAAGFNKNYVISGVFGKTVGKNATCGATADNNKIGFHADLSSPMPSHCSK